MSYCVSCWIVGGQVWGLLRVRRNHQDEESKCRGARKSEARRSVRDPGVRQSTQLGGQLGQVSRRYNQSQVKEPKPNSGSTGKLGQEARESVRQPLVLDTSSFGSGFFIARGKGSTDSGWPLWLQGVSRWLDPDIGF